MSKQTKQTKTAYRNIEAVGNTITINDPALIYRIEKVAKMLGATPQEAVLTLAEEYFTR